MLPRMMCRVCAAATLALAMTGGVGAAPSMHSQPRIDALKLLDGMIAKTVTAIGAAHRSSRRTARRVGRRHGY